MRFLGSVVCMAIIISMVGCVQNDVPENPYGDINLDNWKNHASVMEVRSIYNEIQRAKKGKQLKKISRQFDISSSLCEMTFPFKETSLLIAKDTMTRAYIQDQVTSHGIMFHVERYYDAGGGLRFIYAKRDPIETRIYLNQSGTIIWGVETEVGISRVDFLTKENWLVRPSSSSEAAKEFKEMKHCPELK